MEPPDDELIRVGHILGAQGIKGWVRVFSHTSPRENIVAYGPWLVERDGQREWVEIRGRQQGKHIVAKLDGVDDRNQAEALSGCGLYISARQLPRLPAGDYYWSELIGLEVQSLRAEPLGVIESMLETGADDVMVLSGDRERLIPFVIDEIVREIDLEARRMVVDWSPEF